MTTSFTAHLLWKCGATTFIKDSLQIFTNDLKLNGAVGSEFLTESIGIAQSTRLSDERRLSCVSVSNIGCDEYFRRRKPLLARHNHTV